MSDFKQGAGFHDEQYDLAVRLARRVKQAYPDRPIEITGHSLGGGLSQAASAATGIPGTTFNAAGVKASTFERYNTDASAAEVVNYTVQGEALTTLQESPFSPLPRAVGERVALAARDATGKPLPLNPITRHGMDSVTQSLDYAIGRQKDG